jgi:protease IV
LYCEIVVTIQYFFVKKNTYSLLSSKWMFSGDTGNDLIPFLINIISGQEIKETLNTTGFYLSDANMAFDPFNPNEPIASSSKEDKVGIIQVHHPIFKYDQNCGPRGTQTIMSILENWKNDESVIGVVMDFNSGGGQASGTREIAQYIFNYDKPLVSYSNDIVGSAAFYMYAAADYRMLNEYADVVGSIGAMVQGVNMKGIIEKQGGKVYEVYSDLSPEKNNASRQLQEGNDRPLIEKQLNPLAEAFQEDMKMFLPNISEKALKGDVFSPKEAMEEGMIDSFGTLQNAIDKVFELSKAKKSSNQKPNTNMNTKSLPKLEAVLGLEASLALTDDGSYLNEGQLETIEARIDGLEAENATLQTQVSDANTERETAVNAITEQLTEANNNATAMETSVNAIMENLGLPVAGTLTEKLAAIDAKSIEVGKRDGANSTAPIIGVSAGVKNDFVDETAPHNQIANQLMK